jgi:hypothetical protein
MLFDCPFIADWKKIGEYRQQLTDLNTAQENEGRIDNDYQVGQKALVWNDGILRKAESKYRKSPGQLHQSIQMEQSGFNVETNLNGCISIVKLFEE